MAAASSTGSSGSNSAAGNPRKFSEKIALHKQKEAEEKAEFEKMMKELKCLTQTTATSPQQQQQQQQPQHQRPMGPMSMNRHTSRHLSPPNFPSAVPRHGSLPNVNAAMHGHQQMPGIPSVVSTEDFPAVLGGAYSPATGPGPGGGGGGHVSVRDSITGPIRSNKSRIDTSPYGSERHSPAIGNHLSPPDLAWRRVHSDSSIHQSIGTPTIHCSNQNGTGSPLHAASPTIIRRVHVGNRGGGQDPNHQGGMSGGGQVQNMDHHLSSFLGLPRGDKDSSGDHDIKPGSLPDLSNFHVNNPSTDCSSQQQQQQHYEYEEQSSPYSSSPVNTSPGIAWSPGTVPSSPRSPEQQQHSSAVSAPISMSNNRYCQQQQQQPSSAGTSPSQQQHNMSLAAVAAAGTSPTQQQQQQIFFPTMISGSPVGVGGGGDSLSQYAQLLHYQQQQQQALSQKHRSLLRIRPWFLKRYRHLTQQQQQQHQTPSMSSVSHLCSSPTYSSSSSSHTSYAQQQQQQQQQHPVRLSDNQISEILCIPMALVTEEESKSPPASPSSSSDRNCNKIRFCDTSSSTTSVRNLLHMNKGMATDQGGGMYNIYNQMSNPNGQCSPTSESPQTILSSYRNPGGYMHGSPGRSASPIDMLGSPNSPNGPLCSSPNHSPGVYDSMTGGGGGSYGELASEFQKFTVVESGAASSIFFQDEIGGGGNNSYNQSSQPISDLVNFLENKSGNNQLGGGGGGGNGGGVNHHMAPQTPQTPSSIPDIILTDADESDQAFQNAMHFDLGKLDPNELRMLTEGDFMDDQQIADQMTEEHFKL